MKILYIEDNAEMAYLVCAFLKGHGYDVEHFALGGLGYDKFAADPASWDAVIIDLELPDTDGQHLIPKIAAQRPELPIVVYSGREGLKDSLELYTSGAAALLSKPCGGQDLLDVLKGLIDMPPAPIT